MNAKKGSSLKIKSKDFPTLVEKITRDYYYSTLVRPQLNASSPYFIIYSLVEIISFCTGDATPKLQARGKLLFRQRMC